MEGLGRRRGEGLAGGVRQRRLPPLPRGPAGDLDATRARYGGSDRYAEIEYSQLLDRAYVADWLERSFGKRIDVEETLRRQRGRPKIEYLRDPADAAPYAADSISRGFADPVTGPTGPVRDPAGPRRT